MFIKRLFPTRWATIVAWTGAALAWGSVGVAATAADDAEASAEPVPEGSVTTIGTGHQAMPAVPESGLVVIRYTPVAPPEPEVIVNTVTRSAPAAPKVKSSGS